jgi:NADPH2:quinone reductase
MLAIQVDQPGGPEVLTATDLPVPVCGADQLLVELAFSGVNFIDIYQRQGIYPMPSPYVPGLEGSGVVIEVGTAVTGFSVGDKVAWPSSLGSYSQVHAVNATSVVKVPEGVSLDVACAAMLQGMTAHYLVASLYAVRPGDTALVHAAAGGVGQLLCQMISNRGATAIGTVSTSAKADIARSAGASQVIRYDAEDVAEKVKELTAGIGVDVVYDGVGQATFDGSLASLKRRGMMALFGGASGMVPPFDLQALSRMGSLFVTRPTLADYIVAPGEMQWRADEIFAEHLSGKLNFAIGKTYPLDQAAEAHSDLAARKTTGKLLLVSN